MNRTSLALLLGIPLLGWAGSTVWKNSNKSPTGASARKVACYQDSMHPWIKSDQPGKCTICAMDLTPIYEGDKGFATGQDLVVLNSNAITVLNVQTETLQRRPLSRTLRVAGTLQANEGRKAVLSAPVRGRIENMAVEYAGVEVEKGQSLINFFSPDMVALRRIQLVGNPANEGGNAAGAADRYTASLVAPLAGVVLERNVYSGQYVAEGDRLLTIADASVLWFRFDVYESQLPWFKLGQNIEVEVSAVPGKVFPATISFIEPALNDATRTIKVRAEIPNPVVSTNGHPQRLLRFGMYAEARVCTEVPNVLAVPRSAILFPGGAAFACVAKGDGAYERRRVRLGRQGDGHWEILEGLEEGDQVVTTGNVLIDAQAQFNQGNRDEHQGGTPETVGGPMAPPAATAERLPTRSLFGAEQQKALEEFLALADGVSRALAADSLEELRRHTAQLPGGAASLVASFGSGHRWLGLLRQIEAAAHWPAAADLAAARASFLPFSTNVVELVQRLRSQDEMFRSLKVYQCPMAPKPGLWFQAKGPLRNPYFGAEMLLCGNEVRPPAMAQTSPMPSMPSASESLTPTTHSATGTPTAKEDLPGGTVPRPPARHPTSMPGMETTQMGAVSSVPTVHPTNTGTPPPRSENAMRPPGPAGAPTAGPVSSARPLNYQEALYSPPALREEIRRMGMAAMAGAATNAPAPLPPAQGRALTALVTVADGLSQALAADDVAKANQSRTNLAAALPAAQKALGPGHRWNGLLERLAEAAKGPPAKDLAEARQQFLPLSAVLVEFVKQLRKNEPSFSRLKVYHCPMAPEPGLWMQTKEPLANPFFGAKMLTCGEEVQP
jgi:membrane fusion protein, copper/silver efflux system